MVNEKEVKTAIEIILADRKNYSKSLNYAISYCLSASSLSGHALQIQCLYILNNIRYWRHPMAKEVRITLKEFTNKKDCL